MSDKYIFSFRDSEGLGRTGILSSITRCMRLSDPDDLCFVRVDGVWHGRSATSDRFPARYGDGGVKCLVRNLPVRRFWTHKRQCASNPPGRVALFR